MEPGDSNGWHEYSRLVLAELKRLDRNDTEHQMKLEEKYEKLHNELMKINSELMMLKAKASVWGAIAGAIPALLISIWQVMSK